MRDQRSFQSDKPEMRGWGRRRWTTLFAVVFAGFFSLGNSECGGSPVVTGSANGSPNSSDPNAGSPSSDPGGTSAGATAQGQDRWPGSNTGSNNGSNAGGPAQSSDDSSGSQSATSSPGDECTGANECGSGMACTAGQCIEDGAFRITMVWDAHTDLDLHVRTPLDEELYYRNRNGEQGGEFLKDGCIADDCAGVGAPS